jgi:hypothetical protein
MKLNDLSKIEEGLLSSIKDRFAQGGQQTKIQNIFIKDFIQDAMVSINNGLKGGLVQDPKSAVAPADPAATTSTAQTGTQPATPSSSAAVPTTSPTQVPPAQQTGQKMTPQQTATAKMQTRAGIQPTGQKMTAAQRTQAQLQARKMQAGQKPVPVKESAYDKMNRVFESIININEAGEMMSLSDYLMSWFAQYMNGVAWEGSKPIVKTKIDALAKDYPNNLKANLTSLAQTALALSKAATPAGAPQEFTQMRQAGVKDVQQTYTEIKAALDELSKVNPDLYNKFIKTLTPVTATPGASAGLAEEKKN